MAAAGSDVELGCGLIRLGRRWGVPARAPLSESDGRAFLEEAFSLGIRYFDTAPAYGASEAVLGSFCASLTRSERSQIRLATKVGEHWVAESASTFVDHGVQAVRRSVERSLRLLGRVDVLQVHRTTAGLAGSDAFRRLLAVVREYPIAQLGVSVSDMEALTVAVRAPDVRVVQFPFNASDDHMREAFALLDRDGRTAVVNRPMAMGRLAPGVVEAVRHVIAALPRGVVLTGTGRVEHLRENLAAFQAAAADDRAR